MKGVRPTTASIDLGALGANFAEARRLAGGRAVIAVVKADAYGHGAPQVARRLVAAGSERLAVATVEEAAQLRAAAVKVPILVLGGIHDAAEAADAAEYRATPVVQHAGHVALLRKAARERGTPLSIQLEVDTGMARNGVSPEDAPTVLESLVREPELALDGVYTHLASADEADLDPTREQLRLFGEVLAAAAARSVDLGCVHVANSAALLASGPLADSLPSAVNAVRPGLMLYGIAPAPHLREGAELKPVMSVRSHVANVRVVRAGDPVGYGGSFRARRRGRIATVPIGYADGIPWSLGNRGRVLLRGLPVPMAGRVSMDAITLDVGDAPVEIGDPVLLFGRDSANPARVLPVEELAQAAETIPYEIVVRIGQRVPRIEAI